MNDSQKTFNYKKESVLKTILALICFTH